MPARTLPLHAMRTATAAATGSVISGHRVGGCFFCQPTIARLLMGSWSLREIREDAVEGEGGVVAAVGGVVKVVDKDAEEFVKLLCVGDVVVGVVVVVRPRHQPQHM